MPKISIVIPCRNEELYIERCIRSILANKVDGYKLEVLVCDGLSNDQTPNIVRGISQQHTEVQLLVNQNLFTPFALNLGIKHATGDFVCIFGAHATMHPDFLARCMAVFAKDAQIACVGGVLKNTYDTETSEAISLAMNSSFGVGNAYFRTGNYEGYVDTVAFGLYKKDVFDQIGYFDEQLIRNQDDELNFRLIKKGYKIYLISHVIADYSVRASFSKLFKQYYQYGYWKVYVNKKHRQITTLRQLVPFFFCSYLIFLLVLLLFVGTRACFLGIPLLLYVLLAGGSSFKLAKNIRIFIPIIFSFMILHISYGLGYLMGIVDFFMFNKNVGNKNISSSR